MSGLRASIDFDSHASIRAARSDRMSESGQKRKCPGSRGTSVLPSGADIVSLPRHVRLVPKTEVSGLARRVRFTLSSRHRQPAPACPFGANNGHAHSEMKASSTGAYDGLGSFLMDASQPQNPPYAILADQERRSCPEIWAAYW
jgi:hypothetical protein